MGKASILLAEVGFQEICVRAGSDGRNSAGRQLRAKAGSSAQRLLYEVQCPHSFRSSYKYTLEVVASTGKFLKLHIQVHESEKRPEVGPVIGFLPAHSGR